MFERKIETVYLVSGHVKEGNEGVSFPVENAIVRTDDPMVAVERATEAGMLHIKKMERVQRQFVETGNANLTFPSYIRQADAENENHDWTQEDDPPRGLRDEVFAAIKKNPIDKGGE
jgi:hypothetical protein